MQAKTADIQDVLADSQATFILVVAYTGKHPLAIEVSTPLTELLKELNDDGELVSLQVFKQKELHNVVEAGAMGTSVDLTVMLHEFGRLDAPYTVYYGHVHVADLATWGKYGDRLYHKNIRGFKGSTDVNDAIVETLRSSPHHFLYFNNGITLLCAEIDKQPLGGKSKTSGVFDCKGASVINGAQTVGSILTALASQLTGSAIGADGRVMVRLISLENCPPDFANDVTRAANTQNRIEKRDFAALDKEQYRLRSEMLLSLGKDYVYRAGDLAPSPDKGCTLEEGTVALACAQSDATHAVNAKQAIGRFFEDTTKAPYTILFNSSLTALKLWRAVEMLRAVDDFLKQEQKKREGKEKLCAIHGNRVVLHLVFKELGAAIFEAESVEPYTVRVPQLATTYLEQMSKEVETSYSTSYVGNVFKNISKCKAIIAKIAP